MRSRVPWPPGRARLRLRRPRHAAGAADFGFVRSRGVFDSLISLWLANAEVRRTSCRPASTTRVTSCSTRRCDASLSFMSGASRRSNGPLSCASIPDALPGAGRLALGRSACTSRCLGPKQILIGSEASAGQGRDRARDRCFGQRAANFAGSRGAVPTLLAASSNGQPRRERDDSGKGAT